MLSSSIDLHPPVGHTQRIFTPQPLWSILGQILRNRYNEKLNLIFNYLRNVTVVKATWHAEIFWQRTNIFLFTTCTILSNLNGNIVQNMTCVESSWQRNRIVHASIYMYDVVNGVHYGVLVWVLPVYCRQHPHTVPVLSGHCLVMRTRFSADVLCNTWSWNCVLLEMRARYRIR